MDVFLWSIIIIYFLYVGLESISGVARYGGFVIGSVTMGVSLHNQVLSINRLLGFVVAPLVGLYADLGGTESDIFFIGIIGSIFGGGLLIGVYFFWTPLTLFFAGISQSFVSNGYNLSSLKIGLKLKTKLIVPSYGALRSNFFWAQLITTGFAMPAVFLLNILALKHPDYSSALVQSSAVISGVGNLVLNFYTNPMLSVEESNNSESVSDSYRAIFIGKIVGMLFIAPLFLTIGYLA